jgi:hypothetical protein
MPGPPPHMVPIPLTPPPERIPSPSSFTTSVSFLSSHHSDDYSLMESESYPPAGRSSPSWSSPSDEESPPSSESSEEPDESGTSVSSPPYPPGSPTPSTSSVATARPSPRSPPARPSPPDTTLRNLRDLLDQLRDQTGALWDGQVSTNHMLDDLRGRRAEDQGDLNDRMRNIEDLLHQMLDQVTRQAPRPPLESIYSTSSEEMSDVESLRRRWDDLTRRRQQPIQMPIPVRPGPSLDDQLADLLGAAPPAAPPVVQPPPPLIPFNYQPAARASRPRSTSPTLDIPIRPYTTPVRFEPQPGPVRRRRPQPRPPPSAADWLPDNGETPRVVPTPPDQIMGDVGRRPSRSQPPIGPVIVSANMYELRTLILTPCIYSRLCMIGHPQLPVHQ